MIVFLIFVSSGRYPAFLYFFLLFELFISFQHSKGLVIDETLDFNWF